MGKPELPLTVPREIWDAVAVAVRPTYADSYLSGAHVEGQNLVPHTVTAYLRLKENAAVIGVIGSFGLKLWRPLPFGHPDRPDSR